MIRSISHWLFIERKNRMDDYYISRGMKKSDYDMFFVYAVMIGMLENARSVARAHNLNDIGTACDTAVQKIGGAKYEVARISFQHKSPEVPVKINKTAQSTVADIKTYLDKYKGNRNDKETCDYVLTSTSVWLAHALDGIDENMVAPDVNVACEDIVQKLKVVSSADAYKYCTDKGFIALNIFNNQRAQQVHS